MKKIQALAILAALGLWACDKEDAPSMPPEVGVAVEAVKDEAARSGAAIEDSVKEGAAEAGAALGEATEKLLGATIGNAAPDFELKDEAGKTHKLSDYKGKIVVLEWTNPDCPYVERHYEAKTMSKTWEKLGEEKVVWLAVDSSNFVKPEASAEWKSKDGFKHPVLQDPSGAVGKLYEAKTTPHMYIVDAEGVLRYNGAIDNDPRGKEEKVTNYVDEAVSALLEGKEVPNSSTKPYGCSVKYSS